VIAPTAVWPYGTTTPATMLANPRRVNKDEITRRTPSFAFWCLCGSLAHRPHERR